MPSESPAQQRLMGADLARARKGKRTKTGMSAEKLAEMAKKPKGGYKKLKSGSLPTHGSGELSPIGQRVVAGYEAKYGKDVGHAKFEQAVTEGRVNRDTMFKRQAEGKFSSRTGR